MEIDPEVLQQVTDIHQWKPPVSLFEYAFMTAAPDAFFAYAELFSPSLVIHEGCHFLAGDFTVEAYSEWKATGATPEAIQRVMNHTHIALLFQNHEVSLEFLRTAAQVLAQVWTRTLGPLGVGVELLLDDDPTVTLFTRTQGERTTPT